MDYIIHLRKKVAIIRLWHYELLSYLPNSQLIAQKRECDLIWKDIAAGKQTNHILINYIWEYQDTKTELANYYMMLYCEFCKRNFKFNISKYVSIPVASFNDPFNKHHNDTYLLQCFMNLWEKYMRGQKDFSIECMRNLFDFVNFKLDGLCDKLVSL